MSANDRDEEAPETHTVVVSSPNKPRPSDRLAIAVADTLRRVENNYHREGSGPGSRFEGELLEDVQARTAIAMVRAQQAEEAARAELEQPAPARPHWLVTDFDGYWEAQGHQRTGVEFDREDLSDAFDAGAQAARDLAATAPARLEAADATIRDVLESLCRRDGLPLESAVVPGEPARNYELADRLGVGHVFGLQPQPEPDCPDPGTHVTVRDFLTGRELSHQETAHGTAPAGPQPACRVCDGSGMLAVPDADGESASEQACPDPVHDGDDWFEVGDANAGTEQPAPGADEMRAVIDMIWRMCRQPAQSDGTSPAAAGDRLAARITGLIKNSGMEPF